MSKSSTTTDPLAQRPLALSPSVHPGEYLREELLDPLGLTPYALAARIGVPRTRVERLVREQTRITPDTALRLGRFFSMSPAFWLNLQARHDLAVAETTASNDIAAIVPLDSSAA
jgi:addiction module HigA family antidote